MSYGEFSFLLEFAEAIEQAAKRGVVLPEEYYEHLPEEARARAFTVSHLASLEQIKAVLDSLRDALDGGDSFEMWRDAFGDPGLGDAHLETIYRNAMQNAYNAGRWRQQTENAFARPILMYDAVDDSRTRPEHAALDGFMAPVGDPVWASIYPPNGHRCRCAVISLTREQAEARGFAPGARPGGKPDEGWGHNPAGGDLSDREREALRGIAQEIEEAYRRRANEQRGEQP